MSISSTELEKVFKATCGTVVTVVYRGAVISYQFLGGFGTVRLKQKT